jgi:hypothetical protein
VIRPSARRDHDAVDHAGAVDVLGSRRGHVGLERRVGGRSATFENAQRRKRERRVAQLRDRLVLREEVLGNPLEVGVVPDVLRCATSRDHDPRVLRRVDLGEGEVGVPGVARLLRVRVVALDEVVDDELKLFLARGCDLDVVALFEQALVRIQHLQRLRRVSGEQQDLGHLGTSLGMWRPRDPVRLV